MHTMAKFSALRLYGALPVFLFLMLPGAVLFVSLLREAMLLPFLSEGRLLPFFDEATLFPFLWVNRVMVLIMTVTFAVGLYFSSITLKQILHHGGRAVWVGKGKIRYLGIGVRSIALRHVRDIRLDRGPATTFGEGAHPVIALTLRSGETRRIPTRYFREPPEIVTAALIVHAEFARRYSRVSSETSQMIEAIARDITAKPLKELVA